MTISDQVNRVGDWLSQAEDYVVKDWLNGWSPADIPDLTGKTALVTGGNSGLGFETCRKLAENGAKVFLVSRKMDNGTRAAEEIRQQVGKTAKVEVLQCDMSRLENVINLARDFKQRSQRLDILVNMAGVFHPGGFDKTADHLEQTLAVNYYAPCLLTLRLLDTLRSTPGSRVVFMASAAEQFGRLDWNNLKGDKYKDSGLTPYGTSKMLMLMFAKELSVRVPEVDFLCVHPGLVLTPLQFKASPRYWTANLIITSAVFIGQKPYRGSWSTLYAATEPSLTGTHWGFYGPNNLNLWPTTRRNPANRVVKNHVLCWKLFEETVRVLHQAVGTKHPFTVPLHPSGCDSHHTQQTKQNNIVAA